METCARQYRAYVRRDCGVKCGWCVKKHSRSLADYDAQLENDGRGCCIGSNGFGIVKNRDIWIEPCYGAIRWCVYKTDFGRQKERGGKAACNPSHIKSDSGGRTPYPHIKQIDSRGHKTSLRKGGYCQRDCPYALSHKATFI